ncbi:MAG: PQQ-binding-like beta-propeller repeat protein [Phycisphaerales bacterium]|nr:PQQ-binding-like beta-propeller repeat protein [Phycisphaerales bacterium]
MLAGLILLLLVAGTAFGQMETPENPVYVDDSPAARDMLLRVNELMAQGSRREAVRGLQDILNEHAHRVLPSPNDENLFVPVRRVVFDRIVGDAGLLADFREMSEPEARRLLEAGRLEDVVRTRLLTASGFEAALRLAQLHLESARFEAALRTLSELEGHPDFASRRIEASALAGLVARYVEHEGAARLLERWGVPAPPDQWPTPAGLFISSVDADQPGKDANLAGIVPRPLASATLSPVQAPLGEPENETVMLQRQLAASNDVFSWTLPSAAADMVYTNDGDNITAWDRFTLRPVWRVERREPVSDNLFEQRDIRRRQSRRIEDSCEVTLTPDHVIAITGLAVGGVRQGDGRVHCIDRRTGEVRWSVDVPSIDAQLAESSLRGPAEVVEGTVIVAARKSARERRIVGVYLVGLDLADGSLRWVRLIGSAGALPFQTAARFPERMTARHGVVYRADEIGIIAAVRADDGSPLWVRRYPSFRMYDNEVRPPWTSSGPVVHADSVVAVSPNRQQVVRIDAESGAERGRMEADRLARPSYLLKSAQRLVGVADGRLAWMDLDEFPNGIVRFSDPMSATGGIVGRVAIAGERVMAPLANSIALVDMNTGEERDAAIDESGNALALDGQLLIVDNDELHSYMVWEVASELLAERVRGDPDNPAPAATLAELAYRAGRFDHIVSSVDAALRAIDRNPAAHGATRATLFEAVLLMVDPIDSTRGAAPPRISSLETLAALVERLGALADRPEHMVAHRLVEARVCEAGGQSARAVESLQIILADPVLGSSFWRGGDLTIRADLEATRRLRELLARKGWAAYAAFEREARAQMDLLAASAGPGEFESLAGRYPYSTLAPLFYLRAAERSDVQGRLRLLDRGLRASFEVRSVGGSVDPAVTAELAGCLLAALVDAGRVGEARQLVDLLGPTYSVRTPTRGAIEVDVAALLADSVRTTPAPRRPVIGTTLTAQPAPALEQGRVARPAMESSRPSPPDQVLLVSSSTQILRLMALDAAGTLVERWRVTAPFEPILLEHDADALLIAWLDPLGLLIERLDTRDGRSLWKHRPFDTAPADEPANRAALLSGFVSPLEGRVFSDQVLVTTDERLVVATLRTGAIVTLDRTNGSVVWSGQSDVGRVFDVALKSGRLVVAGASAREGNTWRSAVVSLDARSGRVSSRLDEPPGTVRWVRLTEEGLMIAGLDQGLVCVDVEQSRVRWMLGEDPTVASLDAWVFGDRLFLLDQQRELWRIDIPSGRLERPPLETRGRLVDHVGIRTAELEGQIIFASGSGLLTFSPQGALVGVDVFDSIGALVSSEPGTSVIAMLDTAPAPGPDRLSSYHLHLLDVRSARLLVSYPIRLPATPESITLLDHLVLVSAGEVTMVLRADP